MASNINTTTIDTTYPIAGQDNDSQGFRDNFANTNSNFVAAKSEIEDIQNKGIFTSALTGSTLDNNMNGTVMSSANLVDARETVVTHPETSGVVNLSIAAGSYHTVAPTAPIEIVFSNGTVADWPASGNYSKIRVEVLINDVADTITIPNEVTEGSVIGLDPSTKIITPNSPGRYVYEFSTRTGNSAISITAISNPQFLPALRTDPGAVGSPGDLAGFSGFGFDDGTDSTPAYIWVCLKDYNPLFPAEPIWYRTLVTTGW